MFRFMFPSHGNFIGGQFDLELLNLLDLEHLHSRGAYLIYDGSN